MPRPYRRKTNMTTTIPDASLVFGSLRSAINKLDREILNLVSKRAEIARDVGLAKRMAQLPVFDGVREREHRHALVTIGKELGLPGHTVRALYDAIAREGVAQQLALSHAP